MFKELQNKVLKLLVTDKTLNRRYENLQEIYQVTKIGPNLEDYIVFNVFKSIEDEDILQDKYKLRRVIYETLRDLRRLILFGTIDIHS